VDWYNIAWENPRAPISKFFRVHEALWLPSWRIYHVPSLDECLHIAQLASKMDAVRDFLGVPVIVHCWIRPTTTHQTITGEGSHDEDNYNQYVGGVDGSAHIPGDAVDWHALGYVGPSGCEQIRNYIRPYLIEFGLRMEEHNGAWIHTDNNGSGTFKA